jgi:O-methyltransferase involved in polyketide biosynthesis
MLARGPEAASPTAHYTSYVWARNGLSHPRLRTLQGRALFEALRPGLALASALGAGSLERVLLARHRALDELLERAIEAGEVGQVVELAAGLSPRGWRLTARCPELLYLETDLEGMAERKRAALRELGAPRGRHRVEVVDVLRESGPGSIPWVLAGLDPGSGVAIVSEGLLNYLSEHSVRGLWRRCARGLRGFPRGLYVSDLHLAAGLDPPARAFRLLVGGFVRGTVHMHFQTEADAQAGLYAAGFEHARVRTAGEVLGLEGRSERLVHIIEASTSASP